MRVLITGETSYVGTNFAKRIKELNIECEIDFINVRNNLWLERDFSVYDAIYHVAGIVHRNEKSINNNLYFNVNRDLSYQIAIKAKKENVKSFVYLSTMAVYGELGRVEEEIVIDKDTEAKPSSMYGKSKLAGEELLKKLQDLAFNVAILRVPIIYGPNCPGNYKSLSKLARTVPIFPEVKNKRSMVFIDHLSDISYHIMKNQISGVFLVSNPREVCTSEMVKTIAKVHNKKVFTSDVLYTFVKFLSKRTSVFLKVFGNVYYDPKDCVIPGFYFSNITFYESIVLSEEVDRN